MPHHCPRRFLWLLVLGLGYTASSAEQSLLPQDTTLKAARARLHTGKVLAVIGYFAPISVAISTNPAVEGTCWAIWQGVHEYGLATMHSSVEEMRKAAANKQGDFDGLKYAPSRAYMIGNVLKIGGIGLFTLGVLQDNSDTPTLPALGIVSFVVGHAVHAYSFFSMSSDADEYQRQYESPVGDYTDPTKFSWDLQPSLYASRKGILPGLALTARF